MTLREVPNNIGDIFFLKNITSPECGLVQCRKKQEDINFFLQATLMSDSGNNAKLLDMLFYSIFPFIGGTCKHLQNGV